MLKFRLLEQIKDSIERKNREKELIKEKKPLAQSGISDRQKTVEDKIASLKFFLKTTSIE